MSTRKTFSGRVIHKIFHADKFKSFLKVKNLFHKRNRTRDPRVSEPKRCPLATFDAASPFSSQGHF
jgi:hypothetical protein